MDLEIENNKNLVESFCIKIICLYSWIKIILTDCIDDFLYKIFGIEWHSLSFKEVYGSMPNRVKDLLQKEKHSYEGIKILFDEINEKREISVSGYNRLKGEIISSLANKAAILEAIEKHPEIEDLPVLKPVFFVTLPRTGSTYLHLLLNEDKRWKAPALWEMLKTIPFPEDPHSEFNKSQIKILDTSMFFRRYTVGYRKVKAAHGTTMKDPEELANLLKAEGIHVLIPKILNLPRYAKFIKNLPFDYHLEIYKNIKKSLQTIVFRQKMENRRFLLMHHLNSNVNLDALLTVFEDAQFITIHRDVEQVISSITNLTIYDSILFQSPLSKNVKFISENMTTKYIEELNRFLNWQEKNKDKNERFINVYFKDLIKNPKNVVKQIYKQSNLEYNEECDKIFTNYLNSLHEKKDNYKHLNKFQLDSKRIQLGCVNYFKKFNVSK